MLALCGVLLIAPGCQPPVPAYDATGSYVGEWAGIVVDDTEELELPEEGIPADIGCTFTLDLTQDVTLGFPEDSLLEGSATFNLDCDTIPAEALENIEQLVYTLDVSGAVDSIGSLFVTTGDCAPTPCPELSVIGTGFDDNGDGMLDRFEGVYLFYIQGIENPTDDDPIDEVLPFATIGEASFTLLNGTMP